MKRPDRKNFVIFIAVFIVLLILMHGNEIGLLYNTDKADTILAPILFVICLLSMILFFKVIEFLKTLNVKEKLISALAFIVVALFPMYFLLGACKWIDYYTTDKHWRIVKATVIKEKKSSNGRGRTDYLYTVKTAHSTMQLSTTVRFTVNEVLYFKLCKTNLGMIIVDDYYDSMP